VFPLQENFYLLSSHPTLGAAPLLRYHKYIRLLGEFIFFGSGYIFSGSVELFSLAQWNYFLRLSGFIFFGTMDLSSSACWIVSLRVIIGSLLYNITRCVSGTMDSSSMVITRTIFFGSMDSSSMISADSSSMIITGFFGPMDSSSMISTDLSSIYALYLMA
jgi:hypothetical protein